MSSNVVSLAWFAGVQVAVILDIESDFLRVSRSSQLADRHVVSRDATTIYDAKQVRKVRGLKVRPLRSHRPMRERKLVPPDPANCHAVYHAVDLNFRLKPASRAGRGRQRLM